MRGIIVLFSILFLIRTIPAAAEGTVPRTRPSEYPSFQAVEGTTVAAALLKETEIRQHFVSDLGKGFLVVEVAVYPKEEGMVEIVPDQFILRVVGKDLTLRPENPSVIAGVLQVKNTPQRDVHVVPQVGIGLESGRRYDPRGTGTYDSRNGTYDSRGGVYTSTGVGVLVGGGSAGGVSIPADRNATEIELREKALPAVETGKPVAGHLYFLADKNTLKNKKQKYELEWEGKKFLLTLTR